MKRFLTYFLTGAAVLGLFLGASVLVAKAYVIQPGDTLSALASRFGTTVDKLAADNNIVNKNLIIAGKTLNVGGEQMLGAAAGYTPITGYESRTTQYITASAATIPVASTKDPSGLQIDLTNISPSGTVSVFMSLEPGTTREEPIKCTGVTASSWTGCTRGLPFQGGSETASSTLQKAHNAGSKIIITNVGQFYNNYVNTDGAQAIYGLKTYTQFPRVSSTTALPTSNDQLVSKYYADTVVSTGFTSANIDATKGLKAAGTAPEKVQMNASSTGGISFDAGGAAYFNGVVNTSTIFNATEAHNGNATFNSGVYVNTPTMTSLTGLAANDIFVNQHASAFGDGSDGAKVVAGTETLTRDMYYTTLSVPVATILNTANFRVFVTTSSTVNGIIRNNGNAGTAGSGATKGIGGAALAAGSMPAGSFAGGNGGDGGGTNGTAGSVGSNSTYAAASSTGAAGGAGGNGNPGTGAAGGAGGTNTGTVTNTPRNLVAAYNLSQRDGSPLNTSPGSGGGGGGGGNGANTQGGGGGGGGSSGGFLYLASPIIVNSGTISANGGNGGNGGNGVTGGGVGYGGGGGGGGGNGGVVMLVYGKMTNTGTVSAAGGTGGIGGTAPINGVNGANGNSGILATIAINP